MTDISAVKPELGLVPEGIEVYPRSGNGKKCFILVNCSKSEQTVSLPSQRVDVLNYGAKNSVDLPTYGVVTEKHTLAEQATRKLVSESKSRALVNSPKE